MTREAGLPIRSGILHCDGGARGNPGPAAAGYVLRRKSGTGAGEIIREEGVFIGTATNNEAEYRGLIMGLEAALQEGLDEVTILLDSELVVKQLRGEYRVKNKRLAALHDRARELLGRFSSWKVEHVRRDSNWEADALVNLALDSATGK